VTDWHIHVGDCRDVLRSLPAQSVHTVVTSPPYFGLRDYGTDGQIGLEPTPDEFVAALVAVFREVRRVLRDDGTVWLNLGDSYAASTTDLGGGRHDAKVAALGRELAADGRRQGSRLAPGLKPKDLIGIPWMVAFALRADGWYLRSDIIWSKPNPMPESVTDRPTKSHEYVFLLSKGPRYFYDADAIREAIDPESLRSNGIDPLTGKGYRWDSESHTANPNRSATGNLAPGASRSLNLAGRNKRSVWTVSTQPYPGAHFATFPPRLIEPCILAGAPERACGECGAPWVRVVDATASTEGRENWAGQQASKNGASRKGGFYDAERTTLGFEPSCSHGDGSASGVVLDPFAGAGTTGLVALQHGRDFVGIELNPEYAQMARDRIETAIRLGFRPPQNGGAQIDGQEALFA